MAVVDENLPLLERNCWLCGLCVLYWGSMVIGQTVLGSTSDYDKGMAVVDENLPPLERNCWLCGLCVM